MLKTMLDWLPTVVMLAVVVGVDLIIHQRRARPDEPESAEGLFRPVGDRRLRFYVLFALLVAWWVVPGGWLLVWPGGVRRVVGQPRRARRMGR